jgi:5'-methylthioadenosine phosphorylase
MLAVIGGSGLYDLPGLSGTEWRRVDTPFGAPSDALLFGELAGQKLVFLPRHGRGHRVLPTELNSRANIYALKQAGATQVISVGAVGSLRPELAPGTLVVVDQFVDRTFARTKTFFGDGIVAHVSMAHPVCERLGTALEQAARKAGVRCVHGGTYLVTWASGARQRVEVRDPTREILVGLWVLCAAAGLGLWLAGRTAR